jgi:hypothetical protein
MDIVRTTTHCFVQVSVAMLLHASHVVALSVQVSETRCALTPTHKAHDCNMTYPLCTLCMYFNGMLMIRLKSVRGESDEFERLLRNYLETHPAEDDRIKKLQVHVCCITLNVILLIHV